MSARLSVSLLLSPLSASRRLCRKHPSLMVPCSFLLNTLRSFSTTLSGCSFDGLLIKILSTSENYKFMEREHFAPNIDGCKRRFLKARSILSETADGYYAISEFKRPISSISPRLWLYCTTLSVSLVCGNHVLSTACGLFERVQHETKPTTFNERFCCLLILLSSVAILIECGSCFEHNLCELTRDCKKQIYHIEVISVLGIYDIFHENPVTRCYESVP